MSTPDPRALLYRVPGGMLSNMYSRINASGATDKYEEVLKKCQSKSRPWISTTRNLQWAKWWGTQATMNVLLGQRYKVVSNEVKSYHLVHMDNHQYPFKKLQKKHHWGSRSHHRSDQQTICHPEFETLKAELGDLVRSDEDVLTYALFPKVGKEFLLKKMDNGKTIWNREDFATVKWGREIMQLSLLEILWITIVSMGIVFVMLTILMFLMQGSS